MSAAYGTQPLMGASAVLRGNAPIITKHTSDNFDMKGIMQAPVLSISILIIL